MYNKLTRYTYTIIEDLVSSDNQPPQQQQSTSTSTPITPPREEGLRQRPTGTPPPRFDIEQGDDQ